MIGENGDIAELGRGWVQLGGPLLERGAVGVKGIPYQREGGSKMGPSTPPALLSTSRFILPIRMPLFP